MSIDPRINGVGEPQPLGESTAAKQQDPKAGAAFRALLERLEEKTRALGQASEALDDPRQLGEAVQSARDSVEQAVLLGSDLLEAYRAAQQRAAGDSTTTQNDSQDGGPGAGRGA